MIDSGNGHYHIFRFGLRLTEWPSTKLNGPWVVTDPFVLRPQIRGRFSGSLCLSELHMKQSILILCQGLNILGGAIQMVIVIS